MNWQVIVDKAVSKALKNIPKDYRNRILEILGEFAINPYAGDIERMEGEDVWRRRVGAYRIFYEVMKEKKIIHVFDVKRRTSSTY